MTAAPKSTLVAALLLAAGGAQAAVPVDFRRDVAPILKAHCIRCHGPARQASGLRLDARRYAQRGGVTGLPVLGGGTAENEIYRRVVSDDADYRMPRRADRLPAEQIDVLRRWVSAGTPWPASAAPAAPDRPRGAAVFRRQVEGALPLLVAVLVAALVLERVKALAGRSPAAARRLAALRHVRVSHALLVAAVIVVVHQFQGAAELHARLAADESVRPDYFGHPPAPRRPDHGRRLSGTYYRGNCERDESLYNGGNYRTCSFHVALVDAAGRSVGYGDAVPPDGIFVRVEIERAPNTAPQLFTPRIMDRVFLSAEARRPNEGPPIPPSRAAPLEPVEPDWRWAARWPVDAPAGDAAPGTGMVYLYRGPRDDDGGRRGVIHYGVRWVLATDAGRIAPESELWMGAVYVNERVSPPPEPDRVPFSSWFDARPIPVIDGPHTDDPELLGVPEHVSSTR